MYAGGMPLMWVLGCLFFGCSYLVYKWLFVDFHQKTYGFDEEIPLYSVRLMKWALLFHLLMVLFMYTNKRLLTPAVYDQYIHYRPRADPEFFDKRFDTISSASVLYLVIFVIVFYILYRILVKPILDYCALRRERRRAKYSDDENLAHDEGHSDDIFKEMRMHDLRTLYLRSHKEYELFRTMLNALSYDEEKLPDDIAAFFKKRLK